MVAVRWGHMLHGFIKRKSFELKCNKEKVLLREQLWKAYYKCKK